MVNEYAIEYAIAKALEAFCICICICAFAEIRTDLEACKCIQFWDRHLCYTLKADRTLRRLIDSSTISEHG